MDPSILKDNPHHRNPYGYTPTKWVCIFMLSMFGFSTFSHVIQAIWRRKWYMFPTAVLCGIIECIGTTIIAPTFLAAAVFIIFGSLIEIIGPQYSRLRPRTYAIVFVSFDVLCLVIQAIGGGMASKEANSDSGDATKGGHVMLVGIILQLVEMFIFLHLVLQYFINYSYRRIVRSPSAAEAVPMIPLTADPDDALPPTERKSGLAGLKGELRDLRPMPIKVRFMIASLILTTICLFIRAVYRTAELSDGWEGRIIHTQTYFNVLDGAMIVTAMWTLNWVHPGDMLKPRDHYYP